MRRPILFLMSPFLMTSCKTVSTTSAPKVIYGDDGRSEVYENANTPFAALAASTAVKIGATQLVESGDNYTIKTKSWTEYEQICKDERYADQPAPGMCSAFLVAPDILATAGHCVKSVDDCAARRWVFGYYFDTKNRDLKSVPKSNVYSCAAILAKYDRTDIDGVDLTLIRLDRPAVGRAPIAIPSSDNISAGDMISTIGYPSGLPAKIISDDSSRIRDLGEGSPRFITNLDLFRGNSGSPVFKTSDATLAGLVSNGEQDYESETNPCKKVLRCDDNSCLGERVMKASVLATALQQATYAGSAAHLSAEQRDIFNFPESGEKSVKIPLTIKSEANSEITTHRSALVFTVTHPNPENLVARLINPDGVTSVEKKGLNSNNIWHWSSMFRMSKFIGKPATGVWTLSITDESTAALTGASASNVSLLLN